MAYTVVGLFDSKTEARAAMNELVQNGFVADDIDISEATTSASTSTTTAGTGTGNSVSNFFNHLFGDDQTTARNYTNIAEGADAILTVQVDSQDRANRVAEIFDRHGAVDVDDRASQSRQNYSQTSQTTDTTRNRTATQGDTIPVIEEDLQVGKRTVEQGGVRVRSRVVEKPVEETLRLRQERVVVDRHAVNRAATDADFRNIKDGDIEITERAEVPVVSKQARVVEEVSVGKQVEERNEVVSDTVRKTEVEVDEINTDDAARRAGNRT
jgi:uncharacterized protein (TIGR02271 family)